MSWRQALLDWMMINADLGVVVTDEHLQITAWNRWMEEKSSLKAEEVLGRSVLELVGTPCAEWAQETYAEALKGKLSVFSHRFHEYLFPMKRRVESTDMWMLQNVTISPLQGIDQILGTLTVVEDVTDRVLREREMSRQLRFQDMVTRIDRAILSQDFLVALQTLTDELRRFLECSRVGIFLKEGDKSIPVAWSSKDHDFQTSLDALGDLSETAALKSSNVIAVPITSIKGVLGALVAETAPPGFFDAQSLRVCEALAEQINLALEREKLRQRLVDSEERYRTVTEHAAVGVAVIKERRFLFANNTLATILGVTVEALQERHTVDDFLAQEDRDRVDDLIRSLRTGSIREADFVVQVRRGDGQERYLKVLARWVPFGVEKALLGVCVDVTATHLKDLEMARLSTAIEQLGEGVMIADAGWRIQYVNPAFEAITGFRREELLGRHAKILQVNELGTVFFKNLTRTVSRGDIWKGSFTSQRPNGQKYEVECVISPLMDAEGQATSFVCVERDITQQRLLEKEMRTNQKMQALGTLAGGIAHDFNNILAIIVGYAEILRMRSKNLTPEMGDAIERIADAVRRAKDLIQQILTFARQKEQELKPLNARYVVKEAIKMLHSVLPSTIAIKESYELFSPNDDRIEGDPTQIHQIMINLASNAAYAMRETGGELKVSMKALDVDEETAQKVRNLKTGRYLCLTVSDTGHGMTSEVLERIFEPYFTTKPQGEGTGLGLATVHGIVEGHRGAIEVESQIGQGTTFRIYFPITERSQDTILAPRKPEELPRGTGRVLLVDDEVHVVRVATVLMQSLGYEVTGTSSSTEALELFRQNPDRFDVVFTDQTMPQMTGLKLAAAVKAVRPDIPVVLATGHSDLVTPATLREAGVDHLVFKPYDTHEVGLALRTVLKKRDKT